MLFARMEKLIDGKAPAVNLFSGPYYFAEQLGFRKVIDTTFMIATMIHGNPDPDDLRKFFRACARRSATSICGRNSIRTTTRTNFRPLPRDDGYATLGAR